MLVLIFLQSLFSSNSSRTALGDAPRDRALRAWAKRNDRRRLDQQLPPLPRRDRRSAVRGVGPADLLPAGATGRERLAGAAGCPLHYFGQFLIGTGVVGELRLKAKKS